MNGPHDMGGMTAFGPVLAEPDEPVFHSEWQKRVFALTLAMGATGSWTIDRSRRARESLPALAYWSNGYYEIWLEGLTRLLRELGFASEAEIGSGKMEGSPLPLNSKLEAARVDSVLARGGPAGRPTNTPPGFKTGDKVRTRNMNPAGHTRLPRYLRGHSGEIVTVHGAHVFPDSNAQGKGEDPRWLYTVRFTAAEVWGNGSTDKIHADLWEPYLEPV